MLFILLKFYLPLPQPTINIHKHIEHTESFLHLNRSQFDVEEFELTIPYYYFNPFGPIFPVGQRDNCVVDDLVVLINLISYM